MRSYDHKHPKGRKFSEAELIAHRDRWYERLQVSGGPIAAPEHRDQDRAVYARLTAILQFKGVISYLRARAGNVFHRSQLEPLHVYLEECRDPSFEFLDIDLEGVRAELSASVEQYIERVARYTHMVDDAERMFLQPEMKERDPGQYYKIVHAMTADENAVLDAYDSLVRMARRKLGV